MNQSERVQPSNWYLVAVPIAVASSLCLLATSMNGNLDDNPENTAFATLWFIALFQVQSVSTLLLGFVLGCLATYYVRTESQLYVSGNRRSSTRVILQPTAASSTASAAALFPSMAVADHHEVGEFLSEIIKNLWDYADQALESEIKTSVEPQFKDLPGPLSTLRFSKFTLGSTPIRFGKCSVSKNGAAIQVDADVEWVAKCEIELVCDAFSSTAGIDSIYLKGRLSILLTPMNRLPIVSAVQYALVDQPQIKLACTGLAQQVYSISLVEDTLMNTVRDLLRSCLVLPQRFVCKVDPSISFLDIYQPLRGILQVRLLSGRNVEATLMEELEEHVEEHRVYCKLTLGDSVWRSSSVTGGASVVWSEDDTANFILSDEHQTIDLHAWEEKGLIFRNEVDLGGALLTAGQLLGRRKRSTEVELIREGKCTAKYVKISAQLLELTDDLQSLSATGDDGICGVVEILIGEAFNVPDSFNLVVVTITYGDMKFTASADADEEDPIPKHRSFHKVFHIKLPPAGGIFKDPVITVLSQEEKVASVIVSHSELVRHPDRKVRERKAMGSSGLELEYSVSLRGVDLEGRRGGGVFDSFTQMLKYS